MMYGGGPWMMGGGWFGGIGMMIIGFLGFVLVIVGVVYIIRWVLPQVNNQHSRYIDSDDSLGILKKRYANGEIDKKTFENMKKDLGY